MTNREWLNKVSDAQLACYLLRASYERYKDTDTYIEKYICPDGEEYNCIRDALSHTEIWLNEQHE